MTKKTHLEKTVALIQKEEKYTALQGEKNC